MLILSAPTVTTQMKLKLVFYLGQSQFSQTFWYGLNHFLNRKLDTQLRFKFEFILSGILTEISVKKMCH